MSITGECNLPSQRLMKKCVIVIQNELEFGNVRFLGEGENGVHGQKPLTAGRESTTNSTHV